MIKLNEKDVKAVADSRFWRKRYWILFIGLAVAGGLTLLLARVFEAAWGVIPLFLYFGYFVWLIFKSERYKKEFIKEWKKSLKESKSST